MVTSVTGSQTTWAERRIDLTQWAGYDGIRIRFRMAANGTVESDGWHLDSFAIGETPQSSLPYPFAEDFESGTTNWLLGGWLPLRVAQMDQRRFTTARPATTLH
jgi:hypothetical protein